MPKISAGLLPYRLAPELRVLVAHPGGPFWAERDEGAWSLVKGERDDPSEDLLAVAVREFEEETGTAPHGPYLPLGSVRQKSGKVVHAWAFEGELQGAIRSNLVEIEWPPRSGRRLAIPEIDRAEWFDPLTARKKLNPAQAVFIDRLLASLLPG